MTPNSTGAAMPMRGNSIQAGVIAGLGGGLVFGIVMMLVGTFMIIAELVGSDNSASG